MIKIPPPRINLSLGLTVTDNGDRPSSTNTFPVPWARLENLHTQI
ncbi:MAG: hypothetical protein VKL20_09015 [Synechocystis sp.]|nr:hypothetical protein [Synechocystis sp.]